MTSIDEIFASNFSARKKLIEYLRAGDATAFVGAGASMELYMGWGELLQLLGNKAKERNCADDDDIEFWNMHQSIRPQQIAGMIRQKFNDDKAFRAILRGFFKSRTSKVTGKNYTAAHEVIARIPFKAVVTTNYDPGLLNAFKAQGLKGKPATWLDKAIVNKWDSQDIFRTSKCPLMHIHGLWNRPDSITLDNDSYRDVYGRGYFKVMFHNLWRQQHLVMIGCGFADNWLDRSLDELQSVSGPGDLRHIAFVGIKREHEKHIDRFKNMLEYMYRSEIIFYRINTAGGQSDHSELLSVLRAIQVEVTSAAKPFVKQADSPFSFPFLDRNL